MTKCDICVCRDFDKQAGACKTCSDNKQYVSHFKLSPVAQAIFEELDAHSLDEIKKRVS